MFAGIENYFVLNKMFGASDIFANSEINLLNIYWSEGNLKLELKTPCTVITPPKRWGNDTPLWAYVFFTFHGVNCINASLKAAGENKPLKVIRGKVESLESGNMLELICENDQWFRCNYLMGVIQNTSNTPRKVRV